MAIRDSLSDLFPFGPHNLFRGYHFRVDFAIPGASFIDASFKDVKGLNVSVDTTPLREGGENRFEYQLPTKLSYDKVTLSRGMSKSSVLIGWVKGQLDSFQFLPVDVVISLLNENHLPVRAWQLVKAYPTAWQISDFDAMGDSNIVIETLELNYQYFRIIEI